MEQRIAGSGTNDLDKSRPHNLVDLPLAALANNMLNVRLKLSLALNYVECLDQN